MPPSNPPQGRFAAGQWRRQRRPSWPLIAGIVLLHVGALYGLALALAPDMTATVSRTVVSAFTVTITAPPDPPTAEPEPDPGSAGAPAPTATARPDARPKAPRELREVPPAPRAASTGTADSAGAADAGTGTGAQGAGEGTGSGAGGSGPGGAAASKPVHISGSIDNARDYPVPPGGRSARRGSEVIVRVIVGTDGRARQCSIYRPSSDPEADAITCDLVESRLGFRPATNSAGEPVPAPFYWRQRWF